MRDDMTFSSPQKPWHKNLTPAHINYDNQTTLAIFDNHILHEKMKHPEIDCYYFREKIEDGSIQIAHVSSNN